MTNSTEEENGVMAGLVWKEVDPSTDYTVKRVGLPEVTWTRLDMPPLKWSTRLRYWLAERLTDMASRLHGR